MRVGVPFSIFLHLAFAAAGVVVVPQLPRESTPMVILPVELLTIGDATNVAPVIEEQPDAEMRETRYRAALSRFMKVTGSYPDTLPASKAQFKIATVYERMNEPEIAAQEYVKLAYKYPDSEFLALSMAFPPVAHGKIWVPGPKGSSPVPQKVCQ